MKKIVVALMLLAVGLHVWFSTKLFDGPNETLLSESVQNKIAASENIKGVEVHYEYLDGTLKGNVSSQKISDLIAKRAREAQPAGRIINQLKFPGSDQPGNLLAVLRDGILNLKGAVPAEGIKTAMGTAALNKGLSVTNQMVVNKELPELPWADSGPGFVAEFFDGIDSGELEIRPGEIRMDRPTTDNEAKKSWADRAKALLPGADIIDEMAIPSFGFAMTPDGQSLNLAGWLPNSPLKDRILATTAASFPAFAVKNKMRIAPDISMPEWGRSLPDFLKSIPELDGLSSLSIDSEGLNLSGLAGTEQEALHRLAKTKLGDRFPSAELPKVIGSKLPEGIGGFSFSKEGLQPPDLPETKKLALETLAKGNPAKKFPAPNLPGASDAAQTQLAKLNSSNFSGTGLPTTSRPSAARSNPAPNSPSKPNGAPSYVIYYATSSDWINFEGQQKVKDAVAEIARLNGNASIIVKGFTDSRGHSSLNDRLSETRAGKVFNSLVNQGITSTAIQQIAAGESESTGGNVQTDRRVEIFVTPN